MRENYNIMNIEDKLQKSMDLLDNRYMELSDLLSDGNEYENIVDFFGKVKVITGRYNAAGSID